MDAVIDYSAVEVLTSKMSVAVSCFYFKDTFFNREERDIEGATSEIKDKDVFLLSSLFVEAIGDGSCCRLVDDS